MRFSLLTRDVRLIGTYYLRVPDEHPGYALLKPSHLTSGQLGADYESHKPWFILLSRNV